jgi:flavin-dependent dehydrogenase
LHKQTPDSSAELIAIGSGPSGLSTALHLVRLDPLWKDRVIILEKEKHPREELCGGGITSFGVSQLQALGFPIEFPFVPVEKAELRYRNRLATIWGQPIFIVTQRSEFDAWLANKVRAQSFRLIENSPVIRLERTSKGIYVHSPDKSYHTKAIVGADGARHYVRRWLGIRERPPRVARVLEALVPGTGFGEVYKRKPAKFEFGALRAHLQGYFWHFPSFQGGKPFLNEGIYNSRVDGRAPKAKIMKLPDQELLENTPNLSQIRPKGHPIRWFSPRNRISKDRVLVVGDAAGVDPLFGEGISVSLAYGHVAASYLDRAFKGGELDYKRIILFSPFGRYLLLRWLIVSVLVPLGKTDLLTRGVWSILGLLARFIRPSFEMPNTSMLNFPSSSGIPQTC